MKDLFAILGTIFIFMPVAYTFLHIAGIATRPEKIDNAIGLGIFLWVVGLIMGGIFLTEANNSAACVCGHSKKEEPDDHIEEQQ